MPTSILCSWLLGDSNDHSTEMVEPLGCDSPTLQAALDPRVFLQRRGVQGGVALATQQRDHQQVQGRLEADIQTYLQLYHTIHQRQQALRQRARKPVRVSTVGDS